MKNWMTRQVKRSKRTWILGTGLLLAAWFIAPEIRGSDKPPPLPGSPDYIRQDTEELIALARCRKQRRKVELYARFATRRIQEAQALPPDSDPAVMKGLLHAHRVLWEQGARRALSASIQAGVDLRSTYRCAREEAETQRTLLAGLGKTSRNCPPAAIEEARGLAAALAREMKEAQIRETARIRARLQAFEPKVHKLVETLKSAPGWTEASAKAFGRDLTVELTDHRNVHPAAILPYCAAGPGRKTLLLAVQANEAADRGLAAEQAEVLERKTRERGFTWQERGRLLRALSRVLSAGRKTDPGDGAVMTNIAATLLDENQSAGTVVETLHTLEKARRAEVSSEEIGTTFQSALGEVKASPDGAQRRDSVEKATVKFQRRMQKRTQELRDRRRKSRERLKRLKEWLERKTKKDKKIKDKDK